MKRTKVDALNILHGSDVINDCSGWCLCCRNADHGSSASIEVALGNKGKRIISHRNRFREATWRSTYAAHGQFVELEVPFSVSSVAVQAGYENGSGGYVQGVARVPHCEATFVRSRRGFSCSAFLSGLHSRASNVFVSSSPFLLGATLELPLWTARTHVHSVIGEGSPRFQVACFMRWPSTSVRWVSGSSWSHHWGVSHCMGRGWKVDVSKLNEALTVLLGHQFDSCELAISLTQLQRSYSLGVRLEV